MSVLSRILLFGKNKNKKAYFFIIDAFVGSAIIFLSLLIIFNSDFNILKVQNNYQLTEDYGSFIMNTKLEDINNDYLDELIAKGLVDDLKYTIMDQVTEFYYNAIYICDESSEEGELCKSNNLSYATKFIQNVTDPIIPPKYGFSYIIKDSQKHINITIYNRGLEILPNAKTVIVSKKITYLPINQLTLFGPQITELKIWI